MTDSAPVAPLRLRPRDRDAIVSSLRAGVVPQRGFAHIQVGRANEIAAFARDLRVLRAQADLDYPDMAEKSHYTMRTLASAAGGLRLPTLPVLIAYVNACGGDIGEWEKRWGKLTESGRKGPAALPAADQDRLSAPPSPVFPGSPGIPGPPLPPGARQTGEIYVITSAKPRDDPW